MKSVFVTRIIPGRGMELLQQAGDISVKVWPEPLPPSRPALLERVQGIHGLLCLLTERVDAELLDAAGPQLQVVSQMAVGVDNIDVAACTARGIPVGHTPGVLTEATADLTMALLLGTARQLVAGADAVREGKWQTWDPLGFAGLDVYGSTVGIVGLGRIGRAVARRLQGFDVRLLYHSRTRKAEADESGATYVSLETLLMESDFVILLTALTPETHHLINAARLKMMKPTATLINTSRGEVVDQEALLVALREGWIAYAGLDVTTPEPLLPDHPLLKLPNVTVLPHIGSASRPAREKMALIAAQNLLAGLRGEPLIHCVNPEYG